jgi:hypothetical protein
VLQRRKRREVGNGMEKTPAYKRARAADGMMKDEQAGKTEFGLTGHFVNSLGDNALQRLLPIRFCRVVIDTDDGCLKK